MTPPVWADQAVPTLFIGILLFGGLALLAERLRLRSWLVQLMGIPLLYLLVYRHGLSVLVHLDMVRYSLVFVASLALVFSGAYVKNTKEELGFWNFGINTWARAMMAIAAALIFILGFNLAVLSIQELFAVDIGYNWPAYIAYFFGIFVASLIFYSGIPEDYKALQKEVMGERAVRTLAIYVSFPLLFTYFLILVAYVVKILLTQVWPEGFVAMPVLLFTVLGFGTYALIYPVREGKTSKLIGWFSKIFPWAAMPFLLVYFVALWKRIEPYGLTEMRVLGLLVGAVLAVWALYYALSKKATLRLIPLSLVVVGMLFSFGPWSPAHLSLRSQMNRIEGLLTQNGLMVDGTLVASETDVPADVDTEISNAVDYVTMNYGTGAFTPWLGEAAEDMDVVAVVEALGVTYSPYYGYEPYGYTYTSFWSDSAEPAQVSGYSYAVQYYGSVSPDYAAPSTVYTMPNGLGDLTVNLDQEGFSFTWKNAVYTMPLQEFMNQLNSDNEQGAPLPREVLTVTLDQGAFKAKVFFNSIGWTSLEDGSVSYDADADLYFSVK